MASTRKPFIYMSNKRYGYVGFWAVAWLLWLPSLMAQPAVVADSVQVRQWLLQAKQLNQRNGQALAVAHKAVAQADALDNAALKGEAYSTLGLCLLQGKEYIDALRWFEKARPLLNTNDPQLAAILKYMGDCYLARGYMRQAFDYYREATPLLRQNGQTQLLSAGLESMANISYDFGRPRNAIIYYGRALAIKTSLGDAKGMALCNDRLSKLYFNLKKYDSAYYYIREVQQTAPANELAIRAAAAIDEIVILTFLKKQDAVPALRPKTEQLVANSKDRSAKIKFLAAMANYYLSLNDKVNNKIFFDSAKAMLAGSGNPEPAIVALEQMALIHSHNGDYQQAFQAMETMDKYKDIFRQDNIAGAEIQKAAEINLRDDEIAFLNRENKLKAEKLTKEELLRLALLRQNLLIDSSLENQQQLLTAKETESALRNTQLAKEKELRHSLSRENELKQQLLNDERRNKKILWLGMGLLAALVSIIYWQYKKQKNKNAIIHKQTGELQVLNKEIHHRVKNNLQVISSMLDLQSQSLKDEKAAGMIKESIQRVQSMAFIHQNLYQGNTVNGVSMQAYIKMLSDHLFQTYNIQRSAIQLHTDIDALYLHTDTAIPLGMILNELISNALKYAFKGREKGDIWVAVKQKNNELLLQVKDNGIGLPAGFNAQQPTSFGYEIINAFAQKLKARMNIDGSKGTDVQLIIAKFKTQA